MLTSDKKTITEFLQSHLHGDVFSRGNYSCLGWCNASGEVVAACMFERFNGFSAYFHGASTIKGLYPRAFLKAIASYAFDVMKAKRLNVDVPSNNVQAIRWNLMFGFIDEGVRLKAAHDGGDIQLMVLWPDLCPWYQGGQNG